MGNGVGDAISAIYDAVLTSERWPAALDCFAQQIGAVGAVLVAADKVGLPFTILQATSNYPAEDVRYYFETLHQYDEPEMTTTFAGLPKFQLLRDEDVWGDVAKLNDRPDYKWLRQKQGVHRRAGVKLSHDRGWMDLLALQFAERDWRTVPANMPVALQQLLPHLAKAVEVNRTFMLLQNAYSAVLSALDYIRIGIAIVAPSGAMLICNREARRIFDLGDGLRLGRSGGIECGNPVQHSALLTAVADTSATSLGNGRTSERLLFIDRIGDGRPFLLDVAPLRNVAGELDAGFAGAVVFLIDPENTAAISTERLTGLFDLSQAETAVARAMVDGLSAGEIADLRGTKVDTVRTQFKSIYGKTGVRRRADLVRLAVSVDPPIERRDGHST